MATSHETASLLLPALWRGGRPRVRGVRHADGLFYDAVQPARVYCRPSCPARLVGGRETLNHG
jgi:Metal binding domain of Ada